MLMVVFRNDSMLLLFLLWLLKQLLDCRGRLLFWLLLFLLFLLLCLKIQFRLLKTFSELLYNLLFFPTSRAHCGKSCHVEFRAHFLSFFRLRYFWWCIFCFFWWRLCGFKRLLCSQLLFKLLRNLHRALCCSQRLWDFTCWGVETWANWKLD